MKERKEYLDDLIRDIQHSAIVLPKNCHYFSGFLLCCLLDAGPECPLQNPPRLVTGSLEINHIKAFSHTPLMPILDQGTSSTVHWDSHAWVEADGLICDITVFHTIFADTSPNTFPLKYALNSLVQSIPRRPFIIETPEVLAGLGMVYRAEEKLTEHHANILLNGGDKLGLWMVD